MNDTVADALIQSGYRRWLQLEEAKAEIADDLKELMAELKSHGLVPKALRESFRRVRDQDNADKQEHDAMVDLYVECLTRGMRGRTRENIEEFRADEPQVLMQEPREEGDGHAGADEHGREEGSHPRLPSDRVENKPGAPAVIAGATNSHSSSPQPSRQETKAGEIIPPPVSPATDSRSHAKTSVDNGSITGGAGAAAGEASRLDAGRSASATSEIMDATAGETARNLRRMSMTPLEPREAGGLKGFGFTVRFDDNSGEVHQ